MSLSLSLQNALQAMQAAQAAVQVSSNNIANVNSDGYSRKTVTTQSLAVGGVGTGVRLSTISRVVDENLARQVREQVSRTGALELRQSYLDRTQDIFGTLDSNATIANSIGSLAAAIEQLAATPESVAGRTSVVSKASELTGQLQFLTAQLQTMRREADQQIAADIGRANSLMERIARYNAEISNARALGNSSAEIEDYRDQALTELAGIMDIQTFARNDGQVAVMTRTGRPLVDATWVALSHDGAGTVSAGMTWPQQIDGIGYGAAGTDITAEITGGSVAALIQVRDRDLADLQAQLDVLATAIDDTINAVHNAGTSWPPPVALIGTRSFAAGDAPAMSGDFRVTITDTDGVVVETLDIDTALLADIGDLVAAIDAMANAGAALTAKGQLRIAATGGNRISVAGLDSAVAVGSKTVGLAQFLGLNDLFTADTNYAQYTSQRVADPAAPLGLAGTLTVAHAGGTTAIAYAAGDSLDDIAASLTAALAAENITATVATAGAGSRLSIIDDDGDNLFISDSGALATSLALVAGQPGTAGRLAVRSDILADPVRLATAQSSADPALAVGDVALSAGDTRTLDALSAAFSATQSMPAGGGLPSGLMRLGDYAASIVGQEANLSATARREADVAASYRAALEARHASVSQVNIDEEMANLMILQNAYQAAARVTQTVSDMMDALLSIAN
ncbi:MAG: flagellar hook-associated protein FlgK [Alphaproteobacteria bacterium]